MSDHVPVTCYACDHEYRYFGRNRHPDRCPRCRSRCVTPAGDLTVVADVDVSSPRAPPRVTVFGIDEDRRHFLYHFGPDESGVALEALQIDGRVVYPDRRVESIPIPGAVRRILSDDDPSPDGDSHTADGTETPPRD
ncbi:MAG: hypothetical protein ABEH47_02130 [Haloferacaceae archaeon]